MKYNIDVRKNERERKMKYIQKPKRKKKKEISRVFILIFSGEIEKKNIYKKRTAGDEKLAV